MFHHSQIVGAEPQVYPFSMSLKIHIRELRQARGLTLDQLADKIGVSTPHLSEVERGKKRINNHLIERISSALSVPPESLVSGDGSGRLTQLIAIATRLPDADVERVKAFAAALQQSGEEKERTQ